MWKELREHGSVNTTLESPRSLCAFPLCRAPVNVAQPLKKPAERFKDTHKISEDKRVLFDLLNIAAGPGAAFSVQAPEGGRCPAWLRLARLLSLADEKAQAPAEQPLHHKGPGGQRWAGAGPLLSLAVLSSMPMGNTGHHH